MAILKRVRRVALVAALVAGGLPLLLLGIAHLPMVRAYVLERAREYAARELGIALDAKSLHYNLLGPSADLRDVSLRSVDDKGARALLQADSLRIALGRGLVLGRVEVTGLELVRPRIAIVRRADGTLNLPRGRGAASQDVTPVRLGRVDIRQLTASVDDEMSGRSFVVGPIDLSIDTSSATPVPGAFGPSPFHVRLHALEPGAPVAAASRAPPTTLSGTVTGRLAFDGTRLYVPALAIEAPEGRLGFEGSIDVISPAPRVDVRARARIDLARASHIAGLDRERMSGTLNVTAQATGLLSAPALHLGLEGSRLALRSFDDITLAATSTVDGGRVNIAAIDVRSPLGVVHAKGDVGLGGAGAASHLFVRWTDVELDAATGSLGYEMPARLGSRASGTADLRLAGAPGPAWLSGLGADVSTALRPVGAGLSLAGTVGGTVRDGAWTLKHRLTSAPARASLEGTVRGRIDARTNDVSIGGGTRLRVRDLGAVAALARDAGATLSEPLAAGLRGTLEADVRVSGTAARPIAHATLGARDVQAAGFAAGTVDAALTATREALRVETLAIQLGDTRLRAAGSYAWGGRADVRFDSQASDLAALARTFELTAPSIAGSAQLAGRAWGTAEAPEVDATLDAQRVAIDGTNVGPMRATFALAANRLHVEASAPELAVVARADVDATAPHRYQAEVRLDRTTIPALVPVRLREQVPVSDGSVSGTFHVRGTLRQPTVESADASVDALDAVVNGTSIALDAPATLAWTPSRFATAGVSLRVGRGARARVSGSLGAEPTSDPLRVTAEGPLSELVALAGSQVPANARLAADGTFAVDLAIGGTLPAPLPDGTVSVRAARVAYGDLPPATDLVIDASVDPARIVLRSLGAAWQQAAVSANATVPWRLVARAVAGEGDVAADGWAGRWLASLPPEPARAALSARVTGITPKVLEPFTGAEALRDVGGTMALTVTADAAALSLEQVRGTAVLDEASLTLAGVPFRQVVPTRLRLENGQVRIDELRWDSLGNPLVVAGSVDVAAAPPRVDVKVNGTLDLRALSAFASGVATSGTARADIAIGGSVASPELDGEIVVADGEARVDSPRLVVSDLAGSIRIAKDRAAVLGLTGTINGGAARLAGNLDLTRADDPRGLITLTAEQVAFEYPDGLQTESNARLSLTLAAARPLLSGRIDVLGGTYREPIVLTGRLLEGLRHSGIATAARPPDLLSTLGLDVTVATTDGIRIDNNYGRLEMTGTLRVTGTPDRPGVIGRIEAAPDGEVFLAGNTYRVERLVLDFANPRAIAPEVSFLAQTRVGGVPIDVELLCPADGPCERQVKSLSGELPDDEAEARLFGVPADAAEAGEQLARLLSGEVLGIVSRTVKLDTLRLEQGTSGRSDIFDDPTLVAGDVDSASRLTLGKRLGDRVELAFSQNLTESGFTWSTTYRGPYGLSVRALLLDDQSRSYEFRHEPRFGGSRAVRPPRQPGPRVTDVRIAGTPGFPEPEVRSRLRLTRGDRFQFAAWQRDRDRLEAFYRTRGFYEAQIRARRLPADADGVVLEYTLDRGPETHLEVHGATLPDDVRDRIIGRWSSALFDTFVERDATTLVRDHLARAGHLQPTIATALHREADGSTAALAITIDPGPMLPSRIAFAGNDGISEARLQEAAQAIGTLAAWIDPASFARAIQAVYRDEGFLAAEVDVAPAEIRQGTSVVPVLVREGAPFRIGDVRLGPGDALPEQELREALGVSAEMPYRPSGIAEALGRVDRRLRQAGFLASRTTVDATVRQPAARVDLRVAVDAGPRSILRDVIVEGGDAGKPLVARAIALTPGAPIDPRALGVTRRQLYESGAYRGVEIELQPVADTAPPDTGAAAPATQLVDARIQLLERPRNRFRYGFAVTDDVVAPDVRDQGFGFAADFERRNLFGRGANAGVSARLRRDQQVGRVFLGASRFFGAPLRSTVFLERSRQQINAEGASPIVATVTDLSAEQSYSIRRRVELRYGYALGRNRTVIEGEDFDLSVRIARLTTSGLVDRRSDPFDPASGWFASSNLELSRPSLGSDLSFLKGFLQFFHYLPAGRRTVLASAVRLGLARTFEGQDLIPSERFFAGGAASVRGYREEDLGPRSSFDDASGGAALLIFNEELRFPIYRWLRGVGFVDLGNVYATVDEISLGDLQVGLGAGVRLDTPVGLFRIDLGIPGNPRSFDPKWRLYFGLGHAF